MATKKYLELQNFNDADLLNELKEAKAEYKTLKFDHAITGLENPLKLRSLRRDIARLNTEVRKRQLDAMTPEQLGKRSKIRQRRKLNK
ncbi:MAG: 50S ribosomal protein L29 [Deltaproteobacteria bacterium]